MNETKKLYRLDHGALAGVCGGVAEYFNVDANLVRLIWVALCFAGTAGLWLYVAATTPAFGPGVQRAMLEAEGVPFTADGRVELGGCRWDGA